MSMDPELKVNWEEMFPDEMLGAIDLCPVCYLAYGLAEPHGAYNALGLDWLKARALVERAAREHGGLVAPPAAWHIQRRHGRQVSGFDLSVRHDFSRLRGAIRTAISTCACRLLVLYLPHEAAYYF